jgi:hypothetical protein
MSFFQPTAANAGRRTQQCTAATTSKTDSDYRHLLSPSAAPSRAESIRSFAVETERGDDDDAITPAPPRGAPPPRPRSHSEPNVKRPYRGYASEDDYIKAFTEFLREKQYFESDQQLTGFYGKDTLDDIAKRGGHGPFSKSKADRKRDKERRRKEAMGATLEDVTEAEEERAHTVEDVDGTIPSASGGSGGPPKGLRRMSKGLGRVFTRRGTVA